MLLTRSRPDWHIPENRITPERIATAPRRRVLGALAASLALAACDDSEATATGGNSGGPSNGAGEVDPSASLYPFESNPDYVLPKPWTRFDLAAGYNNFTEFGSHKQIQAAAQALPIRPWTFTIDGMVEEPVTFDIDDLLHRMPLEERVYRHRCVETWAMVVPWSGFALRHLIDLARPLGSARFVTFETFEDSSVASGQRAFWYPWPYTEGIRLDEARNDLAFIATGLYGKPLPKQNGAPMRLVLPWKYGFKSAKSIVRMRFVDAQPETFWNTVASDEYGFWANVNPRVPHPRWSQATERPLGTRDEVPTRLFNGYAEQVASLYHNPVDAKWYR